MSLTYVTKEKYNKYLEMLDGLELLNDVKETIRTRFEEIFDYDPTKNTYSKEKYEKDKESMLKKTNGKSAYSESHWRAKKKYDLEHREEINRKARERYHKKKELDRNSGHIEITSFV